MFLRCFVPNIYNQQQRLLSRCAISLGRREKPKVLPKKTITNFPKAKLITSDDASFCDLPIVVIKATYNNTLCFLTDHKGITTTWTSAGIEGFKNAKRGSNYAGKVAGESLANRANNLGVKKVRVKVKGMGPGRLEAVKGLSETLEIASITDVTPIPHNGPKPKKQRRL